MFKGFEPYKTWLNFPKTHMNPIKYLFEWKTILLNLATMVFLVFFGTELLISFYEKLLNYSNHIWTLKINGLPKFVEPYVFLFVLEKKEI